MQTKKVSFVTKEDREVFRKEIFNLMSDAIISIPIINELTTSDEELQDMTNIRENMIHGFNMLKFTIMLHHGADKIEKKIVDIAMKHLDLFTENYNKMIIFQKDRMKQYLAKKYNI